MSSGGGSASARRGPPVWAAPAARQAVLDDRRDILVVRGAARPSAGTRARVGSAREAPEADVLRKRAAVPLIVRTSIGLNSNRVPGVAGARERLMPSRYPYPWAGQIPSLPPNSLASVAASSGRRPSREKRAAMAAACSWITCAQCRCRSRAAAQHTLSLGARCKGAPGERPGCRRSFPSGCSAFMSWLIASRRL
jgi:hypothetical protein